MLNKLYIVNVPWVFKSIWMIAKNFINKKTLNKINIDRGIPTKNMLEVIGKQSLLIDRSKLAMEYGGDCDVPLKNRPSVFAEEYNIIIEEKKIKLDDESLYQQYYWDQEDLDEYQMGLKSETLKYIKFEYQDMMDEYSKYF